MNEYTRREEVRWTLISSMVLVICIAPAVLLLVMARGKTVPDPSARAAAKVAADRAAQAHACTGYGEKFAGELAIFKTNGPAIAHLEADEPDAGAPKNARKPAKKKDEPDGVTAWNLALPTEKLAKQLASCRVSTEGLTGARPDTAQVWDAISAAAVVAPADGESAKMLEAARALYKIEGELKAESVTKQLEDAESAAKTAAEQAEKTAETAKVVEPIPEHLIPRRLAVGLGVALAVIALVISYLSVRAASMKRMATLIPLRDAARNGRPGLHAASILHLAASHNGGEPGLVMGGALGGLFSAALVPQDSDLFIAGVMAGLIVGLGIQWLVRVVMGASKWRARAQELAEIEKPAIPIVLTLSGVNPGLEEQFIQFFNGLTPEEASQTVEKLAQQAEEKILAAADARR